MMEFQVRDLQDMRYFHIQNAYFGRDNFVNCLRDCQLSDTEFDRDLPQADNAEKYVVGRVFYESAVFLFQFRIIRQMPEKDMSI